MDCSIFQSKEWEEFKLKSGYEKSYRIQDILVLQKKLPFGRTMLYSPLVAEKNYESRIMNQEFIRQIEQISKKNNAIFYRLELNIPIIHDSKFIIPESFIKSFEEMQPEHNWVLDITKSEDEILAGMKQKGRYNIKIAQNSNLTFTSSAAKESQELDAFYEQYAKTGNRHKIAFRNKKYFDDLLEILGGKGYARACTVWHGKTPLASAIIIQYGEASLYLYGGSSDEERNLMAPYLLHWEIIKSAKTEGLKEYNFLGIAPDDNQNHPWAGITRFKKQFGGEQVNIEGSYDLPVKPLEYKVFKIAEQIRRPH